MKNIPNIKHTIAIASGKGGVGKSTIAVNLAIALSLEGVQAGILDADIYGPSQPTMLGVKTSPTKNDQSHLNPIKAHGIQSMSIGYLVAENSPLVWRGPMASMALQQLLYDTEWEPLDYLIIDLPPGTGDIQLSLAQKIPISCAIVVTTPQNLSVLDARRAYEMFLKVHIPILGIIENMSTHVCKQCGHTQAIFGEGGGQTLADAYHIPLLGSLPLDETIQRQTDSGQPTVASNPDDSHSLIYRSIARKILAHFANENSNFTFPNILIQND